MTGLSAKAKLPHKRHEQRLARRNKLAKVPGVGSSRESGLALIAALSEPATPLTPELLEAIANYRRIKGLDGNG